MEDIKNYIQLTEEIGTSGQPTESQFESIAQAGYKTVINLAMPHSDHVIAHEGLIVTSLGMSYIHIPVPFESPTVKHLNQFIGVMKCFDVEGSKVWIHCVVNARVSAFLYHYLNKVKGLSVAQSRSPVLDLWEPTMNDVWKGFMSISSDEIEL